MHDQFLMTEDVILEHLSNMVFSNRNNNKTKVNNSKPPMADFDRKK